MRATMPLSWNEIRQRALRFGREWSGTSRERAEAQTFWNEFFDVFGIRRRTVASFEEPVRGIRGTYGYIDLFWKGRLLAEHKSAGSDIDKANSQAMRYIQDLHNEVLAGRRAEEEIPRHVLISDFARVALHDLEETRTRVIPVSDLHKHVHEFGFLAGYRRQRFGEQDPINVRAVELLGALHDALEDGGYTGHPLERYLVRILFCLFGDDTGIFEPDLFAQIIENSRADGSDLGLLLQRVFEVLATPPDERQARLDDVLALLPYVNGGLFSETLPIADFDGAMREALLRCARLDWSRISPAVFGSLFQSVMDREERRRTGGHYTSERDILKVIGSLFLDDLREELRRAGRSRHKLLQFHDKLAELRFLDPACGCGNFLVIAYRELRLLELELLDTLMTGPMAGNQTTGIEHLARVDVDAFFGIEINEFPARIAEVAMWLMDHQMNLMLSERFGQYFVRLPLRKSPTIVVGNALRLYWDTILPRERCNHVLGNPPFVGAKYQTAEQRGDMELVTGARPGAGLLDYVAGWYFKAADYVRGTRIRVGFVSTNSITQGEQVGVLWNLLRARQDLHIHFAHRTFAWQSEARGKAHVHVVIIGFAAFAPEGPRRIFDYEADPEHPAVELAANISPYLIDGPSLAITNRSTPLSPVPPIGIGNKPIDDGNYLFTPEEKARFVKQEPEAEPYFRRWMGAQEFLQGVERWCLWLGDCPPPQLRRMPRALERVEAVRRFRLESRSAPTRRLAETPTRFHVENMPAHEYLLIPKVSSERRAYIPMGFLTPDVFCSDLVFVMPDATLFHFGLLSSGMHMAWVRQVCGRLESRYRYSASLVYNNFPWPEDVSGKQRAAVEDAAQQVLHARKAHRGATLADLYDPLAMPADLVRAHGMLDRAVDRCYRAQPFASDRQRVEHLFALYEKLTSPLAAGTRRGKKSP